MMKWIIVISFFIVGCRQTKNPIVKTKAATPLCDFLIGEDAGGIWESVSTPVGSTLTQADLLGDCPSIDFDTYGCGEYTLRYIVESSTCTGCKDSTDIIINKCCLNGSATCN